MSAKVENVVIVGTGCAGLTAAIYTGRANLQPLVLEGALPGGQLTTTSEVENFPGFPEGVDGFQLMQNLRKQAGKFGTRYESGTVTGLDTSSWPYTLKLADREIKTKTVIVATGASPRLTGIPGEKELYGGKGVTTCATCDGAFYRKMDVVVIGGGDSAAEDIVGHASDIDVRDVGRIGNAGGVGNGAGQRSRLRLDGHRVGSAEIDAGREGVIEGRTVVAGQVHRAGAVEQNEVAGIQPGNGAAEAQVGGAAAAAAGKRNRQRGSRKQAQGSEGCLHRENVERWGVGRLIFWRNRRVTGILPFFGGKLAPAADAAPVPPSHWTRTDEKKPAASAGKAIPQEITEMSRFENESGGENSPQPMVGIENSAPALTIFGQRWVIAFNLV